MCMKCRKQTRSTVPQTDKNVLECEIKTGRMSLNWSLSRRDAHQSRLEGLDGRGHNDSSRQLVPNPNSSRKKTAVEGIDTPSWNTELTTASSRILSVWSQVQWCRYCDQSINYSIHHQSSALAWFLRTSNVFQPSCCIIIVGLPLLLDERPDWLCGLLQSWQEMATILLCL